MDVARSSSYLAIGISNIAIIATLAYIPYMLTKMDSVRKTLKVKLFHIHSFSERH